MSARVLTPAAADDRNDFERIFGTGNCSCHISPPCSSCVHPGNPANQEEDPACWIDDSKDVPPEWEHAVCLLCDGPVRRLIGRDAWWHVAQGIEHEPSPAAVPAMVSAARAVGDAAANGGFSKNLALAALEGMVAVGDIPTWKGIPMKDGYCICRDCRWPIRRVNREDEGLCWAHVSAVPRCRANPVFAMRQEEIMALQGGDRIVGDGAFSYLFSAERNAGSLIDLPACEACDQGEDVPQPAPKLHRGVPMDFAREPDFTRMAPPPPRYDLWKFFADEHDLHLLESELDEIIHEVLAHQGVHDWIAWGSFTLGVIVTAALGGLSILFFG